MEWEVARTSGKCVATDRPLAEGEAYYAVLLETPEGFERRDYALDAWQGPPEGAFCYWRARVPARQKKSQTIVVDNELLTAFFLRLQEQTSPVQQQFRFVLALLLLRKRILRLEGTQREGGQETWKLRLMVDESTHELVNPRLTDEEVERLSMQLTAILSGEVQSIEALETPTPDTVESGSTEDEVRSEK